jgi:hypothetical protein
MKKEKITITVRIENDRIYTHDFNLNQKLQVIVNQTLEHLGITSEGRQLRRDDGSPLNDLTINVEEAGIRDGEILTFIKKAPKPDRDKGFAIWKH